MKKIGSIVGTIFFVLLCVAGGSLKYWNVFGQAKLGRSCDTRAGCRSFQCLHHALRGATEVASDGYCTMPCEGEKDCEGAPGLRCVTPSQAALDDLPKLGRPKKLCQRAN